MENNNKEKRIIKEPFASEIREKLKRYAKGEFTEEELKQQERSKEILKEYNAVWETDKNTPQPI